MTLTLNIESELEMQVRCEAARRGCNIQEYVVQAVAECLRRDQQNVLPCLSEHESQLLQQINIGLPEETWQRYRALVAKRRHEDLTPDEHREIMQISDRLEHLNAHRIALLIELARLRNLPLRTLMQQLGITPTDV